MPRFPLSVRLGALCLISVLFSQPMAAQEMTRQITVTGQAQVDAVPDMALLTLGVTTQAETAAEAMGENARKMTEIQAQLTQAGIAARDIQTRQLQLNPEYTRPRDGTARTLVGYRASNLVQVRVRDLDGLGAVLSAVTEAGLNTLNGLSFAVQDPDPLIEEARKRAVADALARAKLYTDGLNVTLGPVLRIDEHGQGPRPMPMARAEMALASDVPVSAGEVGYGASVTVVFGLE